MDTGAKLYPYSMPDPISKDDQFPRSHKLSPAAAFDLHFMKTELDCWDAYLESHSTSATLELLIWFWHEVRREGKTEVNPLKFRSRTRRGRPAGINYLDNARPSRNRVD